MDAAKLERSGQAQQILPVSPDEFDVDAIARKAVEGAIIGASVDAPEAGVADISEAWAELISVANADAVPDIAGPRAW
jgi:hypothetical protein